LLPARLARRDHEDVPTITDQRLLQQVASYLDAALNNVEVSSFSAIRSETGQTPSALRRLLERGR
jgi:hypothetical protein